MCRNVLGVIFLIASGYFLILMSLLSFSDATDSDYNKFIILGFFCIPFIVFHLIGLAFYRGTNWRFLTGITLVSSNSINFLIIISAVSIRFSSSFDKEIYTNSLDFFNDYISGFTFVAVSFGLGLFLILSDKYSKNIKKLHKNSDV